MTVDASKALPHSTMPPVPVKSFVEFFAGVGLVYAGLKVSGWRCDYANDNDARKRKVYQALHGTSQHFHLEDITKTDAVLERIPQQPFLATASFPCIDMSLAGHYRGFEGNHSSVFFSFVEALQSLGVRRPSVVMLENVTGFITSRDGSDFAAAAQSLANLGYFLDAFVLNANHFTPQSRPRVFVVGVLEPLVPADQRPWWRQRQEYCALRPKKLLDVMSRSALPTDWIEFPLPMPPTRNNQLIDIIEFGEEQEWWNEREVDRHYAMMFDRHKKRVDELLGGGGRHVAAAFRRIRQGVQRAETRFDGLAGCLRTPRGGSAKQILVVMDRGRLRMRWMSHHEYARLQGLDNAPPVDASRNELLLAFGDAVCVPAIRWIDEHILTPIYELALTKNGKCHAGQSDS